MERTLIEKSIVINGMGRPDIKTIFNIEKEEEKNDVLYRSLAKISGRKLSVNFKCLDGEIATNDKLQMIIPSGLDEEGVKNFIISEINNNLNEPK